MVEISAALVKALRDETNVGMMECKKALVEAEGDKARAIKLLRERGAAVAGKKASRAANSGLIAASTREDGRQGVMIEVNCETDFVARNEGFQGFVSTLLDRAGGLEDGTLAEAARDDVTAKIQELGENIVVRRNVRLEASGPGLVAAYVHLGSRVGVLVELGCTKDETARSEGFKELAKDLTLHVAACAPLYADRTGVPEDVLASEREIYAKQVENKPPQIVEKIVEGKLRKFFAQHCFVEQGFVKDPDRSVTDLLAAKGKELGDTIEMRRFVRYQLGEEL